MTIEIFRSGTVKEGVHGLGTYEWNTRAKTIQLVDWSPTIPCLECGVPVKGFIVIPSKIHVHRD